MTDFPAFVTEALCASAERPDDWFPPADGEGPVVAARAKAVCQQCPSRDECLAYALRDRSLDGVWGATSAKERDRMRRGMDIPPRKSTTCSNGHRFTPDNTPQIQAVMSR